MNGFTRLSDVELVENASENATVLIEDGKEIKRVPKSEVGGGGTRSMFFAPYNNNYLYQTDDIEQIPNTFNTTDAITMQKFKDTFLNSDCIVCQLNYNNDSSGIYRVTGFEPYSLSDTEKGYVYCGNKMRYTSFKI